MTQENSYYSFEISAPRSPLKHFEAKERNVYCSFVDETFFENGLTHAHNTKHQKDIRSIFS